ncbi:MAG: hypothetical protein LUI10_11900 [Lachnospiraceae bacterium]|nr:hypothetical protein [Lachnospiraceae bacterium]
MFGYTVDQWLFFFYFYCFCGWVFESTYVSVKERHFVNRGFMHGPFLPLYGSGAIMMLVVSRPFADNLILTYIAGCVGATVLEYLTGAWMEALFKIRYWDYSNQKFNIKGYVCLSSTLVWGLLTILMTRVIHTHVESLVFLIPTEALSAVVSVLTVYIGIDLALSFKDAFDLRDMLIRLENARQEAAQLQAKLSEAMDMAGEQLVEKKEKYTQDLQLLKEKLPKPGLDMDVRREKLSRYLSGMEVHSKKRTTDRISSMEVWREKMSQYVPDVDALRDSLKKRGVDMDQLFERMESTRRQYADLKEHIKGMSLHPLKHNPTLSSDRFKEALKELREEIGRNDEEKTK